MKVLISKKTIFYLTAFVTLFILFNACSDNSTSISPPDFSTVPGPWDTSTADTTFTKAGGDLTIYVLEKGNGIFEVNERDYVSIRYTGRTQDGYIFTSSWTDGNTSPNTFYNLYPYTTDVGSKLIEGFRQGLLGMSEGEKRTVIIPPSLGYGNTTAGSTGYTLRNDTLIYDIELVSILN